VQGAELLVLNGANNLIENCSYLYIEISTDEFYKDATKFGELNKWLENNNFKKLWEPEDSHCNVLYEKKFH